MKERSLTEGPRGAEEEHWTGRQGSPAQVPAPALVDWVRCASPCPSLSLDFLICKMGLTTLDLPT